jgi:hypothetical protein
LFSGRGRRRSSWLDIPQNTHWLRLLPSFPRKHDQGEKPQLTDRHNKDIQQVKKAAQPAIQEKQAPPPEKKTEA